MTAETMPAVTGDLIERLTAETYESDQHGIWAKPRNPDGKEAKAALEAATAREAALVAERDAMARQSLSSSNQAAKVIRENRQLVAQSQTVLQREAETIHRYDAKVEALEAHSETMRGQLQRMVDRWEALTAENERLRALLGDARDFVCDQIGSSYSETCEEDEKLLGQIDAALEAKP